MPSDTDELRAALENAQAELAAMKAREVALRQDLEADPELVLQVEQVMNELQAARTREEQLVDAVKRARAERAEPVPPPELESDVRPPPDLAALSLSRPARPPAPERSDRPRRILLSLGVAASALSGMATREPSVVLIGVVGIVVLAFALRNKT